MASDSSVGNLIFPVKYLKGSSSEIVLSSTKNFWNYLFFHRLGPGKGLW